MAELEVAYNERPCDEDATAAVGATGGEGAVEAETASVIVPNEGSETITRVGRDEPTRVEGSTGAYGLNREINVSY